MTHNIKRYLQLLGIGLSAIILMMAGGCVRVNIVSGTPNGHVLLMQGMTDPQNQLLDCIENPGDSPTLNCRNYQIKLD